MKKLGKNEQSLSLTKLISAGLLTFTVPENTEFVVDKGDISGTRVTGFLNSEKRLVGWGLTVKSTRSGGTTTEAINGEKEGV